MATTTATIARDILVQAAAGLVDMRTFPGAAFTKDQLAVIWNANAPEDTYHAVDEMALDVDPAQSTSLQAAYAGATLVYWGLMIANGQVTVPQIDLAVTVNENLMPSSLAGGAGQIDLRNAMQSLVSPGIENNDPFGAFPGLYPVPPDQWQQAAMAALVAAGYASPTQAQVDAAANAIMASLVGSQVPC